MSGLPGMIFNPEQDELFSRFLTWRAGDDDPDEEPAATACLDRRASFAEWLRAQGLPVCVS